MEERRVELFIPGDLKDEPIICSMIKNYDIEMRIVEASFSTESGWAYLIINGEKTEIENAFGYLREKGITIELRED